MNFNTTKVEIIIVKMKMFNDLYISRNNNVIEQNRVLVPILQNKSLSFTMGMV